MKGNKTKVKKGADSTKPKKSVTSTAKKKKRPPLIVSVGYKGKGKTSPGAPLSKKEIPPKTHMLTSTTFVDENKVFDNKSTENNYETGFAEEMKYTFGKEKNIQKPESNNDAFKIKKEPEFIEIGRVHVTVRNVTDYTLRDVKIFDNDFMNQQNVHYSTHSDHLTYKELLIRRNSLNAGLNHPVLKIMNTHIASNNKSQVFRTLWFTYTLITGEFRKIPCTPVLDPNQNQSGVTIVRYSVTLDQGLNIIIDSLDPDTRVTYSFSIFGTK